MPAMNAFPRGVGWIETICGSMFSGKTEELIRRVKRAVIAKQVVQVFKPRIDTRYDANKVVSHSAQALESRVIDRADEIFQHLKPDTEVVGIDEVQFFKMDLLPVVEALANKGLRVICAGLDQDYLGKPFEPMPQLLAISEYITKELAICVVCGNPANRSQRIMASDERSCWRSSSPRSTTSPPPSVARLSSSSTMSRANWTPARTRC